MQRHACAIVALLVVVLGAGGMAHAQSAQLNMARSVVAAAERGDASAQTRLGFMFERGIGVPQNYSLAAKWYHLAAEQGDPRAQQFLGILFNKGFGVPVSFMLSYKWLNLAASRARRTDRDYYARLRDSVASKLSKDEIEQAQHWALEWYPVRYR